LLASGSSKCSRRLFILSLTNGTKKLRYLDYFNDGSWPNEVDIYFANLYWFLTIVSTVGFGDYYPLNLLERIFIAAIMIFSALFFGYLVNAIGKFMMENQQFEISIKIKLATINSELKDKNVSKSVSILVLRYLEYALRKDNSYSDEKNAKILDSIHPDLKFEILKEIYVKIFKQIKGFEDFSETVLAKFAQSAQEWSKPPGTIIIDETAADQEQHLYYIANGSVIVFLKDSDCYLKELGPTQIFGEFGFFTGCNRFSSVMSKDYVTLVRFSRRALDKCLDPLAYEKLVKLKYQVNMYSDFSFFDIICYSCRGRNHTAKNCKYTHFEMNKRTLVAMKRAEVDDRKICIRRNRRPFFAVICNKEIRSAIVKLQAEQIRNRMSRPVH
jgi:hypothetical protein